MRLLENRISIIKEYKMKLKKTLVVLLALMLAVTSLFAEGSKEKAKKDDLVTINFWYNPAIVEAGSPPSDWFVYERVRNELGINLVLTPLPSSAADRDVKMNAAGAKSFNFTADASSTSNKIAFGQRSIKS